MKIIIDGDFFDCQVYRGCFYLWDMYGTLHVVDSRESLMDAQNNVGNALIYHYKDKSIFAQDRIASFLMDGGIYPNDTVMLDGHLYAAMEDGLFKRYIPERKRLNRISKGSFRKISHINFFNMSVGKKGLIALSGGNEGVFEIYEEDSLRVPKHTKRISPFSTLYKVAPDPSAFVEYEDYNILSTNFENRQSLYRFELNHPIKYQQLPLRSYRDSLVCEEYKLAGKLLSDKRSENLMLIQESPIASEWWVMGNIANKFIPIASKPRKIIKASFGTVIESRKEVVVEFTDGKIERIEGPITNCRVMSGFGRVKGLLIIVLNDRIEIRDFKDEQ